MHGWMDESDWAWMSTMMLASLVVLGAVVYVAVRLATQSGRKPNP